MYNVYNLYNIYVCKPTHSGVFMNYTSFMPHYFKVSLVKTLVTRAYRLCSNWHLFDTEIHNLIELLMHNGYNKVLLKILLLPSLIDCT